MISLSEIKNVLKGSIEVDEPMRNHTWIKIGGPADFYIEPEDKNDLLNIISYFNEHNFPCMIIGRGSNLLVSDSGIRGAVISVEHALLKLEVSNNIVVAESGVRLTKFVDFCIQNEFAGVEMLAGIPGTIGGAIVMNAGIQGCEISDNLIEVEIIRNNKVCIIKKQEAGFGYRKSGFEKDFVLSAKFKFEKGNKEILASKRHDLILKRNATQPLELPNLGSIFKNPPNAFAARLIEQAGLKGKRIGDAQISDKHANFIVNLGNAKSEDVLKLIDLIVRTVYQNSGIMLELEIKMAGF